MPSKRKSRSGSRKARARKSGSDKTEALLVHLVALELWRGGLSQSEIRQRLGLNMNAVNAMLSGVSRRVQTSGKQTA